MGQVSSFAGTYCVPVEASKDVNESAVYRFHETADGLVDVRPGTSSMWDYFQDSVKRCGDSEFLGHRPRDENGKLADYQWITYKEAEKLALRLGSSLLERDLCPEHTFDDETYTQARKMRVCGVYAKNCPAWFILEQACSAYNIVLVPLYDTLGEDAMAFIIDQTRMETVMVSIETAKAAINVGAKGKVLKTIILIEPSTAELQSAAREAGLTLLSYADLIDKKVRQAPVSPASSPDAIFTVNYTSGTTGMPKGVLLTHRNFMSCCDAAQASTLSSGNGVGVSSDDVVCSYLPLAHAFERLVCSVVWTVGAKIGCYSGNVMKLMDDIKVLEPTVFVSVPRLFNRIADRVSVGIQERSNLTRTIFDYGLSAKINNFRTKASTTSSIWDLIVFGKTKKLLGSRLRFMVSGGAPLDPQVHEKMQCFFCVPLLQGYGLTETVGPAFLCHREDTNVGHIGGLFPSVEFRLSSVPEMNYMANANPPTGELCLRGNSVCVGYFRNREVEAEAFDKDGFFHTGDVVQLLPTNAIAVIDRKKNIFKLAQGEYIAPEKIENQLSNALAISQVFVYGDSLRSKLVAIVNPDPSFVDSWIKKEGKNVSFEQACQDGDFQKFAIENIQEQYASLKGFEKPARYAFTPVDFSTNQTIMTPTQKIKRHEAKAFFAREIDELYDGLI